MIVCIVTRDGWGGRCFRTCSAHFFSSRGLGGKMVQNMFYQTNTKEENVGEQSEEQGTRCSQK